MPRRAELDPTPALLAGALVLGLLVQLALPQASPLSDLSAAEMAGRPARRLPSTSEAQARLVQSPAYAAILGRPLFSPSRSGGTAVAADVAAAGTLALLGVASDGGRASATLAAAGAAPRSLRLGEVISGWRLSGVGRDHAILSRGAAVQVLRVGAPLQTPTTVAAVPGGAPVR